MEKRQRSVTLSFVLLRFAAAMLGSMLLCVFLWLFFITLLQNAGIVYHGSVSNQQVEEMLADDPQTFVLPGEGFLPEYVLLDEEGKVLQSNVNGKRQEALMDAWRENAQDMHIAQHTYADGSTVFMHWYYRKEFANPVLRRNLPPFEYLWWAVLGLSCILCLLLNTMRLRRKLAAKLKLFQDVSEKVRVQELDFAVPHAGIREYDEALDAMERMRLALYDSLSSQWAAQQEREAEIAALAHDLKTPLTLVGGNAELLLEEELPENCRKMAETILAGNNRAKEYVADLIETSFGMWEAFESVNLFALFDTFCKNAAVLAESAHVQLKTENNMRGTACVQSERLLRALGNIAQNAIEHTPRDGTVHLTGSVADGEWKISVYDEGGGFSRAALIHATERLWRDDPSRSPDGHHGIGLWFASQVAERNGGRLKLCNGKSGGIVTICGERAI